MATINAPTRAAATAATDLVRPISVSTLVPVDYRRGAVLIFWGMRRGATPKTNECFWMLAVCRVVSFYPGACGNVKFGARKGGTTHGESCFQ